MADIIANKKKTFEKEIESHITESSKTKSKTKSDYTESIENEEDKKKKIKKENENEFIRKEKSEYLCKFNRLKNKEKWTSLSFDMNSSLEEIKNEFDRVTNAIKVDRNVQFYKKMLLLGVQGVEMMNSKFDPLGVDLDGWSEAMTYNMDNQEYDDVMAELYEKYKHVGEMSPELKLIFMIISSGVFFSISKKLTNIDSTNGIMNFLGKFASQDTPQPRNNQNQSETVEDNTPSKIPDPQQLNDNITLTNIMATMKKRESTIKKAKKTQENTLDENTSIASTKTISANKTRKTRQKIIRKY